jgi:hypothetical protein
MRRYIVTWEDSNLHIRSFDSPSEASGFYENVKPCKWRMRAITESGNYAAIEASEQHEN